MHEISSDGNIFRVIGHLCGEFLAHRWIPRTKASDTEFDVFFDLRLSKRLSKQSSGWWFETLSHPFWRHCNGICNFTAKCIEYIVKFLQQYEVDTHKACALGLLSETHLAVPIPLH